MASRNRDTLKHYFSDGAMPSSDMFADLIDSMLNMDDEGFTKSIENGLEISHLNSSESLISFFKQLQPDVPVWRISFDGKKNNLIVSHISALDLSSYTDKQRERLKYVMNFSIENQQPRIGIGLAEPEDMLHVDGNIRSQGRRGISSNDHPKPLADGDWHTIAGPFVGCQTFEVMARAKNDRKKRYSMMHAIAMHTISPTRKDIFSLLGLKNRIRYTHSFYDSFLHRLKLRWQPGLQKGQYILQIRTNCDFGKDGTIDFHITNLWSDQDITSNEDHLGTHDPVDNPSSDQA